MSNIMKERRPMDQQGRIVVPAIMRRRLNLPLSSLTAFYNREKKRVEYLPDESIDPSDLKEDLKETRLTLPEEFIEQTALTPGQHVLIQYFSSRNKISVIKAPPLCTICGQEDLETPIIKRVHGTRASGEVYICQNCARKICLAFM